MGLGAIIMIIVLLLMPIGILMSGAVASAILGGLINREVDSRHEGSELSEIW